MHSPQLPRRHDVLSSTGFTSVRQARQWECSTCGTGRDAAAVEALLIREVAAQSRAYQLQDLKCLKCRQVGCADMYSCRGPHNILQHHPHGLLVQ